MQQAADALARARDHSPFLRDALVAQADVAAVFADGGAEAAAAFALAAAPDLTVDPRLRRGRRDTGLALAVALGDLAGELPLERVTGLLSDFADKAIDEAAASDP